jgi:hypothetical protein
MKDYQNVFHRDHHRKGPEDDREDSDEIFVGRLGGEGRGINIKRTGSNVTVDDPDTLVCEP